MEKVLILNSGKCSWGNCIFCGWGKHDYEVNVKKLIDVFDSSVDGGVSKLKIFCSGSFLDYKQFPREFQEHVARVMQGRELVIESRPEFITSESLSVFNGVKLIVAIGLEAADDVVLSKLRKGLTVKLYERACELIISHGFRVKSYILVNPPFDYNGLLDKTVNLALKYSSEVVLINTYPHAKAELFNYWINGDWSPINEVEFNKKTSKYKDNPKIKLDFDNYSFEPRFPVHERLVGVGVEFINHPYFNVWQDYFVRFYHRPVGKDIALFIPCSKRKPYYKSRTHKAIRRVIAGFEWYKRVHFIVISNPGVIPIEFSGKYPFDSYDWNERFETPEVMREYVRINTERVKNYLKTHRYSKVFSYFKPDSESGIALDNACKSLNIKLIKLCDNRLFNNLKGRQNPLIHPLMLRSFKSKMNSSL